MTDAVQKWLRRKQRKSVRQTKAERAAEKMAAEIIAIADDATADVMERETAKGETQTVPNREAIARAKLRIDTRMWLMTRLAPHIYGATATKPVAEPLPLLVDINLKELEADADSDFNDDDFNDGAAGETSPPFSTKS